ncbi:hypothetical protein [Streptomyces sp. H27-C3]|uniref:hypothetical protein n=1 Tax=Streptomyces sp. H27-C3 TaxID=3046305 RepID=UPI0024BB3299|nr:hypothetical protein [Streptomyces sp. H27-C3]MDJ0466812.1 hypothetical protein [Streptomyces sp. H27-C3]
MSFSDASSYDLVPYASKEKGLIALRSWSRTMHAEVGDITVANGMITVHGELYGPSAPSASPALLLLRRIKPSDEIKIVGERHGGRGLRSPSPARRRGSSALRARCVGPLGPLRAGQGRDQGRPGLDDVLEKKATYLYPTTVLPRTGNQQVAFSRKVARKIRGTAPAPQGRVRVRVFYTITNDLDLNVVDLRRLRAGAGHFGQ